MLVIVGTLCKAGILKGKARDYLAYSFPGMEVDEIDSVTEYAYTHNPFGCDRRTYKKKEIW